MNEVLLTNILCQLDKIKILGSKVDSNAINFLSLLRKYETYVSTNNLTTYSDKINQLIFTMENKCCKIIK